MVGATQGDVKSSVDEGLKAFDALKMKCKFRRDNYHLRNENSGYKKRKHCSLIYEN